ncbi:MAG: peptide chain release factor N(5)-glutamine methyltransferase [Kiritimatiellae bacterium]|nr:peptide chain release factor N(5)-glutamine methyltransferase [Kiritimatiellia bacterium]
MNWGETISKTSAFLASRGVPDAQTAAELMAARLLRTGRGFLAGSLAKEVDARCLEAMRRGIARLVKGEPLQYVLGEWDFRTLTLKCDRRALIPRPETEELVTRVLAALKPGAVVVDVGTGTGAIILSLAGEFRGEAVFLGTDVSEDAVALAKENAARCGLSDRVKFAVMDGLDDFDEPECVDVIVSNPPYIESAVCETLDPRVRDFEPRMALDGGATGLDFYDRYLSDALNVLKPGGSVFFEIGESQGAALAGMFADYGFTDIRIEKDFAGHDRYAMAALP